MKFAEELCISIFNYKMDANDFKAFEAIENFKNL